MDPFASLRRALWHDGEARPRGGVRLVAGGVVLTLVLLAAQFAVVVAVGPGADFDSPLLVGGATVVAGVALTLALVPVARSVDRRAATDYGFRLDREWWLDCGFGLALGVGLQAAVFLVGWLAGWFTVTGTFVAGGSFLSGFGGLLALFLVVGVYEEALARGWLLTNVAESFRFAGERAAVAVAVGVSSLLFGLLHLANPGATALSTAIISLAGVMLALGYLLTGELAIPVGVHVTWNLAQGGLFGHGVSGLAVETTVLATEATGPALWTGGAFGPEGGLLGLLGVLGGCVAIAGWVRYRGGDLRLHPAVTTPDLVSERDAGDGVDVEVDA